MVRADSETYVRQRHRPGPGVMVEPITEIGGQPLPLEEANSFPVPITNIGEATETFPISSDDLPAGWETEADEVEFHAGEEGGAFPSIVPAADAATGEHPARRGWPPAPPTRWCPKRHPSAR